MNNTLVYGFDVDAAYKNYLKRIKKRIAHINKLGEDMFDGNVVYDKGQFTLVAVELAAKQDLDPTQIKPDEITTHVINYQTYGNFKAAQAKALKKYLKEVDGKIKLDDGTVIEIDPHATVDEIRAKGGKAISEAYKALKASGLKIKDAQRKISNVFFGSE
jgi:hypothetical protein